MTDTSISFDRVEYRLTEPVVTARGTVTRRSGFVVQVAAGALVGHGEVLPLPGWSTITEEEAGAALAAVASGSVASADVPAQVRAGIDAATWMLRAAEAAEPLWSVLGGRSGDVPVNALVAGGTEAELRLGVEEADRQGFGTIKVKMGFADDAVRIDVLDEIVGGATRVRLDPNGAWDPERALDLAARAARRLGDRLEYIEDPVGTPAQLAPIRSRLEASVGFDSLADSWIGSGIDGLARPGDVMVLKPALVGGIDRVRDVANRAGAGGIDVVISSLYDGPAGLAAWCHLAAASGPGRAHGLGTAALVDHPAMAELVPRAGAIRLGRSQS